MKLWAFIQYSRMYQTVLGFKPLKRTVNCSSCIINKQLTNISSYILIWWHMTHKALNKQSQRPISSNSNSNSKRIYLTKSTPMYPQDIINIQKMTLIVGRLLLWYKMYRFRESHPVNTNRQCHNCHSVYPLPWLEHWKANFEYILFSLSSGWFRRIEYEEHWSFFDRRATRTILGVNQ